MYLLRAEAEASHFVENLIGGLRPPKRLAVLVVRLDVRTRGSPRAAAEWWCGIRGWGSHVVVVVVIAPAALSRIRPTRTPDGIPGEDDNNQ